ncbi:MAG: hypothetical protein SF069_17860 [Phycisphaerae bacterium]|nr:hypothetical protein [Phycisphaerae bacterium]
MRRSPLSPFVAILALATTAGADTIRYQLAPDPDNALTNVEISWQTRDRTTTEALLAESAPGLPDIPALVGDVAVDGADTAARNGATWRLTHRRGATLTLRYAVKGGQRGLDWEATQRPVTNYRFFHALGKVFLLTPAETTRDAAAPRELHDVTLRWRLPEGWSGSSSLGVGTSVGARLSGADIRDATFLAGKLTRESRKVGPCQLDLSLAGEYRFNSAQLADLAEELLKTQMTMVGETDLREYVVHVVPVGAALANGQTRIAGSGLLRSFALWLPPNAVLDDAVENLFAHEMFHQWNGRTLRAAMPDKLAYWFVEGFTDYFAMRSLLQSGRWTPKTYAKWINRCLRDYAQNPEKNASNERIAADYWNERATVGEAPYQRGHLLALRWTRLAQTHGKADAVDQWFRALLDHARSDPRFELTNAELRTTGRKHLGEWFVAEFDRYVADAATIDLPLDALGPRFNGKATTSFAFDPGFSIEKSIKAKRVEGLRPGSAAAKAGLRESDKLLSWTIPRESDRPLLLRIRRGERDSEIKYLPRGAAFELLQFEPIDDSRRPKK